jgi:hypothetical protein
LPATLAEFEELLRVAFQQAGFDARNDQLPASGAPSTARKEPSAEKRRFLDGLRDLFN